MDVSMFFAHFVRNFTRNSGCKHVCTHFVGNFTGNARISHHQQGEFSHILTYEASSSLRLHSGFHSSERLHLNHSGFEPMTLISQTSLYQNDQSSSLTQENQFPNNQILATAREQGGGWRVPPGSRTAPSSLLPAPAPNLNPLKHFTSLYTTNSLFYSNVT